MREDQRQRLADLEEKLVEVFLDEADPDNWPGAGLPPNQMEQKTRGDRYWSKKNAAATMVLLGGVGKLTENTKGALGRDPYSEPELDKQISSAEAKAQALVERVVKKARDTAHGK